MSLESITTPAPADVPASLADAEALAATASDVYDIACREMRAAQDAMTEASRAYLAANREWERAGAESAAAQDALATERRAAGLALTATGYRQATR